ncbi:hypothetical protein GH714_022453 [Hevea brasiliensis]|uniref:Disease resistance R13L4/SHOC-2-like LRR domain-containing protein n=1 Tax=Hevea brasiliensis TaxID=3981 RepID=A0A6A6N6B0_HEVBR|nr:hypothetical protein GH714_022453 [Hevea brasiliensis]
MSSQTQSYVLSNLTIEDDNHKSIKYDVWASTPNGNNKLGAAFRDAERRSASWKFKINGPQLLSSPDQDSELVKYCPKSRVFIFIEPLGNFKLMDLSYSHDLMRIPDLSSIAPNIEFLYLKRCYSLVEIPSLKNLSNLTELDLCECYKVKDCPEIPCNIKILTLDYTGIEQLPSSIKHLSQLVTLSLNECTELVSLPSSIGNLKRLEQLNLVGCSRLMTIPSSIGNLKRLEELHLGGCSRLVTIPSSIGELKCLEKLLLFRCSNLASLPESIKQLSKLKQLDLSICESLKILPELPSCLECLVAVQDELPIVGFNCLLQEQNWTSKFNNKH